MLNLKTASEQIILKQSKTPLYYPRLGFEKQLLLVYLKVVDKNTREARAREIIEASVGEGYSLRYVVVEALLSCKKEYISQDELNSIVGQLKELIEMWT